MDLRTIDVSVSYNNKDYSFSVSRKSTLDGFHAIVEKALNCSNFKIEDVKEKRVLSGPHKLKDWVTEESSLVVVLNKEDDEKSTEEGRGYASKEGQTSYSFGKCAQEVFIAIDKNAPPSRQLKEGLNLVIQCSTQNCNANGQEVYLQKGMGEFSMAFEADHACCQTCRQKTGVSNIIFWDCVYILEGQLADDSEKICTQKQAPHKTATTFNQDHKVSWKYLTIECTEAPFITFKQTLCVVFGIAFGYFAYKAWNGNKK